MASCFYYKPLLCSFQFYGEVSHQGSLPDDFQSSLYLHASVVHVFQCGCYHFHVIVGIDTTWNAKTQQVESAESVFSKVRRSMPVRGILL